MMEIVDRYKQRTEVHPARTRVKLSKEEVALAVQAWVNVRGLDVAEGCPTLRCPDQSSPDESFMLIVEHPVNPAQ